MLECTKCGMDTLECRCDKPAEGYECERCGRTPTWRELQHGTCSCSSRRTPAQGESS